jgi:hypothetical protein
MGFLHGIVLARADRAASRIMWSWRSRFKQLVRRATALLRRNRPAWP